MIDLIIVGEGQTEETFVNRVITPSLLSFDVLAQPRLIRTSGSGRGGALSRDRVLRYLRNTLRERPDTYVTTLIDLYGLAGDFPGVSESMGIRDPIQRAVRIQARFAEVVVQEAGCRADRFLPYVQPYEFEALLFSDITGLAQQEPGWRVSAGVLQALRDSVPSPEHINDGPATHPSARLTTLLMPSYHKVLHGPLIAERIGLDRIRRECAHFAAWLKRLEGLPPL